ncbi:MAG: hypothetical protein WC179_01400 [Candidatus Cloacimonadaceae bacterium]|jgi:hypothetical protein|nr:hypothetical protein [Candidatus Cloacimonadota bacterium]MDY0111465.1 hypothetical protein [Candidatus Syntrophosphaera sp.]
MTNHSSKKVNTHNDFKGVNLMKQSVVGDIWLSRHPYSPDSIIFDLRIENRNPYSVIFKFFRDTVDIISLSLYKEFEEREYKLTYEELARYDAFEDYDSPPDVFHPLKSGILYGASNQKRHIFIFDLENNLFSLQKSVRGGEIASGKFSEEGINSSTFCQLCDNIENLKKYLMRYYNFIKSLEERLMVNKEI